MSPSCRWTRSAELRSPLAPLIISYEALIWFPARLGYEPRRRRRKHVRVVGIANTTIIRASARSLQKTVPIAVRSVEEAVEMVRSGRADAFALSHDS